MCVCLRGGLALNMLLARETQTVEEELGCGGRVLIRQRYRYCCA